MLYYQLKINLGPNTSTNRSIFTWTLQPGQAIDKGSDDEDYINSIDKALSKHPNYLAKSLAVEPTTFGKFIEILVQVHIIHILWLFFYILLFFR